MDLSVASCKNNISLFCNNPFKYQSLEHFCMLKVSMLSSLGSVIGEKSSDEGNEFFLDKYIFIFFFF